MKDYDQWLDRELRMSGSVIPNDGFSDSVMSKLPSVKRSIRVSRLVILIIATILGVMFTVMLGTPLDSVLNLEDFSFLGQYCMQPDIVIVLIVSLIIAWIFKSVELWHFSRDSI